MASAVLTAVLSRMDVSTDEPEFGELIVRPSRDALHVPALAEHVHAYDATGLLAGRAKLAHRINPLSDLRFAPLVGIEDFGIDLERYPG